MQRQENTGLPWIYGAGLKRQEQGDAGWSHLALLPVSDELWHGGSLGALGACPLLSSQAGKEGLFLFWPQSQATLWPISHCCCHTLAYATGTGHQQNHVGGGGRSLLRNRVRIWPKERRASVGQTALFPSQLPPEQQVQGVKGGWEGLWKPESGILTLSGHGAAL